MPSTLNSDEPRQKKPLRAVLGELAVVAVLVVISGFIGFAIGQAGKDDIELLKNERSKLRQQNNALIENKVKLEADMREKIAAIRKNDPNTLAAALKKRDRQWRQRLNEARVEAEIQKAQRVSELEARLREVQIGKLPAEQRNPAQNAGELAGIAPTLSAEMAEDLSPRVRDLCGLLLGYEGLSPEDYRQKVGTLEQTHEAEPLVQIKFSPGSSRLGSRDRRKLRNALRNSSAQSTLLVAAFADKSENPEASKEISMKRAEKVVDYLKPKLKSGQKARPVYLGETTRFGDSPSQNRLVELWNIKPE